ncbi:efflux RND transporter permease subunit [Bartonella sp. DGB1]|uniref:efflux RND transporter permease subunit n=1 Tax=Bartonella sp. DGB1 TaxID=3239807 RepID=UPI00352501AD
MFITRVSVRHPVFTAMLMLAIVVIGLVSYSRLALNDTPSIDIPIVVISTQLPGASPEVVADTITNPIERVVSSIAGIKEIYSTSSIGSSMVIVQFNLNVSSNEAFFEVQQKVSGLQASFPTSTRPSRIVKADINALPIISISLFSPTLSLSDLTSVAENTVVTSLGSVEGVAQATVKGGAKRQITITPDLQKMQAYNISPSQITQVISANNKDRTLATLDDGRYMSLVVLNGKIHKVEEFGNLIVDIEGGTPVFLKDIATIVDGAGEKKSIVTYNGQNTVSIEVVKMQTANTVSVADNVKRMLKSIEADLKDRGVSYIISEDRSKSIRDSVDNVKNMLIEGALLTVVIVFLFLNSWRSTIITGITLPVSVIGTFAAIHFLGFTLNQMTLLGLSLSIGILIDDAIVVRENITRHLHMGKSHLIAAIDGTTEIGLAVLATTLSIVAVFFPVAFMDGIIGRYFFEFGMTIVVAVLISLFVSFTLDPMLSSVWKDPAIQPNAKRNFLTRQIDKFDNFFHKISIGYGSVIAWSLKHRLKVLFFTIAIFILSLFLVGKVTKEFIPSGNASQIQVKVSVDKGSSLEYVNLKVRQAEAALKNIEDIESVVAISSASLSASNQGSLRINLKPVEVRKNNTDKIIKDIRANLNKIVGARFRVRVPAMIQSRAGSGSGSYKNIVSFSIVGISNKGVVEAAKDIAKILKRDPRVKDITSDLYNTVPYVSLRLKQPIATDLGISVNNLSSVVNSLFSGVISGLWEAPDGEGYDVVLQLPKSERKSLDQLHEILIPSGKKGSDGAALTVAVGEVVNTTASYQPSSISHENRIRNLDMSFSVEGISTTDYLLELEEKLKKVNFQPGVKIKYGGDAEDLEESVSSAIEAFYLIVILLYLILASQFGSFIQPFSIMVALPLSLIGVVLGLLVMGSSINMLSIIGFLLLMGLVTKNSILLIDYSNKLRSDGVELNESLIAAGKVRFRPIIMTSMAMILGMTPIAIGGGEGGDIIAPMAHAVIGGLISSTLLTLLVVPVIITYFDKFERFLMRISPFEVDHEGIKNLDKKND